MTFPPDAASSWTIVIALVLLSAVTAGALAASFALQRRWTGPNSLRAASSSEKWRWAVVLPLGRFIWAPLLGLIQPHAQPAVRPMAGVPDSVRRALACVPSPPRAADPPRPRGAALTQQEIRQCDQERRPHRCAVFSICLVDKVVPDRRAEEVLARGVRRKAGRIGPVNEQPGRVTIRYGSRRSP